MSSHLISLKESGISKRLGTSFPAAYLWVQCNRFEAPDVRFFSQQQTFLFRNGFLGIISVLQIGDKEYRLATYYGARLDSGLANKVD